MRKCSRQVVTKFSEPARELTTQCPCFLSREKRRKRENATLCAGQGLFVWPARVVIALTGLNEQCLRSRGPMTSCERDVAARAFFATPVARHGVSCCTNDRRRKGEESEIVVCSSHSRWTLITIDDDCKVQEEEEEEGRRKEDYQSPGEWVVQREESRTQCQDTLARNSPQPFDSFLYTNPTPAAASAIVWRPCE